MANPPRGRSDFLDLGNWNVQCYRCGHKRKAGDMWRQWQGFWVCPEHWEPRQPQDFVRNVPDVQAPPWLQPWPDPTFVLFCTPNGRTAIAGVGVAGCMIAGFIDPAYTGLYTP